MKLFYREITPGMPAAEVKRAATKENYRIIEREQDGKQAISIIDAKAMGRYICEIALEDQVVTEARYLHND